MIDLEKWKTIAYYWSFEQTVKAAEKNLPEHSGKGEIDIVKYLLDGEDDDEL